MKKIAVFVDVQNIYYTVKQTFNGHFNYLAFWNDIKSRGEIVHAYAYAIERHDKKQKQFQQVLSDIGFEVKLKPYIQRRDGTSKGDWDVGITIDVMTTAPLVDIIILASGDGDFAILLERIKHDYPVTAEIISVRALTADALVDAASKYHPIDEHLILPISVPPAANRAP